MNNDKHDSAAPSADIPAARVQPARRRPALIWLVPLIAVAVGLGLAVRAVMQRGPEIDIQFLQAEGLEANKTRIKYKDVDIGTVTAIALSKDRRSVWVTAQMSRGAKKMLVEDSRFWVVRPRIAAGNVSGLATLLSGVYIAIDPGKSEESSDEFVGLETPPLVTSDVPGRQFLLAADELGALDIGSPVYFRRIPVGRVIGYGMREDGKGVDMRIFVEAPYDRFVTRFSRFWQAGGISVAMNSEGVKVDMQSLVSLMLGGIAFSSPDDPEGGEGRSEPMAAELAQFKLYADAAAAQRMTETVQQPFLLIFRESVRGLSVGAPVDFRGLTVGEVVSIELDARDKSHNLPIAVEVRLYPQRFYRHMRHGRYDKSVKAAQGNAQVAQQDLDTMVANGLRAQLQTGNLLSGQRYIALDFFPNTKPAKVAWQAAVPELPTQPGTFDSLQAQLVDVANTLQKTLKTVDRLAARLDSEIAPEIAGTLKDARGTLDRANRVLTSDAPLQQEMREALREVGRAAAAVRNLADLLERQPEALITGKKEK